MYNQEVEERLASVMLIRWDTAVARGDYAEAVSEATLFVSSQLSKDHPIRLAFVKLGFIPEQQGQALASFENRKDLLVKMLSYVRQFTSNLPTEQQLVKAPFTFYTAALLLSEEQESLLDRIISYSL